MTRHLGASIWAGLLFLMAPYLFTDLHARGAIAETISLCLLPVALYYTTRCFASPRRRYVLLTALAWTAIAHTHNIIYLYGVLFIGLYVAARLRPGRRYVGGSAGWRWPACCTGSSCSGTSCPSSTS